jgi:hypothetical protein
MRVKINQAIASPHWSYRRGQVVEMGAEQGATWVQSGLATEVDTPEAAPLAVEKPEEAQAQAPARVTASKKGKKR